MSERIDKLKYRTPEGPQTREPEETSLFLTGPAEFLCRETALALKELEPWRVFFGEYIDPYKRMDYPMRAVPAMRLFNNSYTKEYESWFINGDLLADLIFPASIRRIETEQIPDTVSAALMQQFRSQTFFERIDKKVPGLNELGRRFEVDKNLAFEWQNELVPLVRCTINFRMDLREWDTYLEQDCRTKEQPFDRTLANLRRLAFCIEGVSEGSEQVDVELKMEQDI